MADTIPDDAPLTLNLCSGEEEHPLEALLLAAAERAATPGVVLERGDLDDLPARPALVLAHEGRTNIRYLAAPEGPEAEPFLEAIARYAHPSPVADDWGAKLADLEAPADVRVFVAAACPHCPHVVRAALAVSLASPLVTTTVIDAAYFPDLAKRHAVRSVPLTLIDGGLSVTGALDSGTLVEHLLARGTEAHETGVFASMVEGSRFDDAAAAVIAGSGLAHFLAAWRTSALSERMGLMIVAEQVLEDAPDAMNDAVGELAAIVQSEKADASLRGDTADLLGKIGHADAIPTLEALSSDPHPDVAEIAAEALEELRGG